MASKSFPPKITIDPEVLDGVEAHAYSNLAAEVGGMLVGSVSGASTNIIGFVPATTAAAEQISLTFTHDVWADILATVNRDFPDSTIVGWYHTHPSFGLFLSQYDEFIQRNFFANAGQVALVIDPIEGTRAWFAERADEIVKFDEQPTKRGPRRRPDDIAHRSGESPSRARVIISLVATALLAGALGWGIAQLSTPPDARAALQDRNAQYQLLDQQFGAVLRTPVLVYTVAQGDTLASIVQRFYGSDQSELVRQANQMAATTDVTVGQALLLPNVPNITVSPMLPSQVVPTPTPLPATPTTPSAPEPQTPTPTSAPSTSAPAA